MMFDDLHPVEASIDKIHEMTPPKQITDLDPENHSINKDKLEKFVEYYEDSILNLNEKHPDYLIIDNFLEYFGLSKEAIQGSAEEGQILKAKTMRPHLQNRQDLMLWFKDLAEQDQGLPSLKTIAQPMAGFRSQLNDLS